jgi:hypothetical protein
VIENLVDHKFVFIDADLRQEFAAQNNLDRRFIELRPQHLDVRWGILRESFDVDRITFLQILKLKNQQIKVMTGMKISISVSHLVVDFDGMSRFNQNYFQVVLKYSED